MSITAKKDEIRKMMLSKRASLPSSEKADYDTRICKRLLGFIEKNGFTKIHCYLPMGSEIDISPLIQSLLDKKLIVVAPKTLPNRKIQNLILESLENLAQGLFGTSHPGREKVYNGDLEMIIIPGLAYDNQYYRLGYGGGYYDDFLKAHPKSLKLGVFYPFQKIDKVPIEDHDVRMDGVVDLDTDR